MVYYNEIDPFAAAWLEKLIDAGHIAYGVVDRRSIEDVLPNDLKEFTQCHFFAGIGVWSYALRQARWSDERPVWTGSCPCQPFSAAGRGAGTSDERHLWPAFYHLIEQCRPATVFGEQVASKAGLEWFDIVQNDLERADYTLGVADLCAASVGAPHIRQRLFWLADPDSDGSYTPPRHETKQGKDRSENWLLKRSGEGLWNADWVECKDGKKRPVEPGTFPLVDGATNRVGRLRGYGNAIVAPLAQVFIETFMEVKSDYVQRDPN